MPLKLSELTEGIPLHPFWAESHESPHSLGLWFWILFAGLGIPLCVITCPERAWTSCFGVKFTVQLQRDVVRIQKQWTDNIHTVPLLSLFTASFNSALLYFLCTCLLKISQLKWRSRAAHLVWILTCENQLWEELHVETAEGTCCLF